MPRQKRPPPLGLLYATRKEVLVSAERVPIFGFAIGLLLVVPACGGAADAPATSTTPSAPASQHLHTAYAQLELDTLVLSGGGEMIGKIIAKNSAFYVFEPNERRKALEIVERDKVRSVKWAKGSAPDGVEGYDQIVLTNGHILNGRITEHDKKFGWYWIQSWHGDFGYRVYEAQVGRIFRGGKEVQRR
jgi:hypothetical protein